MKNQQFILDLNHELIIDNFAGGGGGSTGIEMALGRHVDHAINHDRFALGMHRINHPQTVHHWEDVFDIDPVAITEGRPVGLAHFSPDCKHFSKAKGGKPLDKRIRGLVLVMLRWANVRARVMTMENVEEIQSWCPLVSRRGNDGKLGMYPDTELKGRTWHAFLDCLSTGINPHHPDLPEFLDVLCGEGPSPKRAHWHHLLTQGFGYRFEYRELKGHHYGAPTIRNRLFMIARRDGRPILWPVKSHEDPKKITKGENVKPWRTIAECIDWSIHCPSIFLTSAEAKAQGLKVKRPLVVATKRRIAKGMDRYVLKAKQPFLVSLTHQGGDRIESVTEPGKTITGAKRGEKGLTNASFAPLVTEHANASSQRNMPADGPMRTACGGVKGGHFAVVAPTVVNTANSKTTGRGPNTWTAEEPLRTQTSAPSFSLMTGTVVNTANGKFDEAPSRSIDPQGPLPVQTGIQKFAAIAGTLVHCAHGEQDKAGNPRRGRGAHGLEEGCPTLTTTKDLALGAATLVATGYGERKGQTPRALDLNKPGNTAVAGACKQAPVVASMIQLRGDNIGFPCTESGHTTSAGGQHHAVVAGSIVRSFGESIGQHPDKPAPATTAGGGGHTGLAACYLAQHNGGFNTVDGREATQPLSAVTGTGSQQQIVAASAVAYYGSEADGQGADEASRTGRTKGHLAWVESPAVTPPLTPEQIEGAHRVAAFLREFGVEFEGEFATITDHLGQVWVIIDIGMRMLTPRELYRAQGFPEDYIIDEAWVWDPKTSSYKEVKLTKEQQIRMCGNSVCPPVMAALIRANVPELIIRRDAPKKATRRPRAAVLA